MKLLVVSDTHGAYGKLALLLKMHRDADALIFLGDGLSDLQRAGVDGMPLCVFSVRGNCDSSLFGDGVPEERELGLGGSRFLAMHGHTRGVKYGLEEAVSAAVGSGADVLLYGHTHAPFEKYLPAGSDFFGVNIEKPLYIFNPGSLGSAYDGHSYFGIIEAREGGILFSHGTL